jgi:hypothetical protein
MKIYVAGCSTNKFLPLDNIREKYLVDKTHEGRNIDFLNKWYCELTALFYLWQHNTDSVVGLEHYRAYFWHNGRPLCESDATDLLKTSDVIAPGYSYPFMGKPYLRVELDNCVRRTTDIFCNVLRKFNAGLTTHFVNFLNGKRLWCCNMFVAPRDIMDKWCKLIFPLLAEFEKVSPLNGSNLRREGYFTEFLFGAWLEYNKYSIQHVHQLKLNKELTKPWFWCVGPDHQIVVQK